MQISSSNCTCLMKTSLQSRGTQCFLIQLSHHVGWADNSNQHCINLYNCNNFTANFKMSKGECMGYQ